MAGHAQLKFVMTECSKTQIRLTGLILCQLYVIQLSWFLDENSPVDGMCNTGASHPCSDPSAECARATDNIGTCVCKIEYSTNGYRCVAGSLNYFILQHSISKHAQLSLISREFSSV